MSPSLKRRCTSLRLLAQLHRAAVQVPVGIELTQFEVVLRDVRLQRELHRAEQRFALRWSARDASTLRPTRPNRSASYDTVPCARHSVALVGPVPCGWNCDADDSPSRVGPKPAPTCGNHCERAERVAARASSTRAAAAFRFWFAASACVSSESSTGSPNTFHHSPRCALSDGSAVFHVPACSPAASVGASLNAAGVGASGRL